MNAPARSDVHRPLELVTENYEYLYSWDSQAPGCLVGIAQSPAWAEWHSKGPVEVPGREVSSGQCTHCGAWLRYVALVRYIPTGQYLYVGETCLDNRFGRASADFHRLRKQAELDRKEQRILAAWEAYKAEHATVDWDVLYASENGFVKNVLAKGRQYGNLSDRQLEAIIEAVVRDVRRSIEQEAQALEVKGIVTAGRQVITGTVVSLKEKGTDFGIVWKITVKSIAADGSITLFWGTRPSQVSGATVGTKVTFTATVEPSGDKPEFGFYSRPSKASIVNEVKGA